MSNKIKHLLLRDGRYFSRLVIPDKLRPFFGGKTELRQALGADRRDALRKHTMAVANFMHQISAAERRLAEQVGIQIFPGRYPLTISQMALRNYEARLQQDEDARNSLAGYAKLLIDDGYAAALRDGIAGQLQNRELEDLVGHRIQYFKSVGNTAVEYGTGEWRALARALCISEYEALSRVAERDEGDIHGKPASALLRDAEPEEDTLTPVSLKNLFEDYLASRQQLGRGREAKRRWSPVITNLGRHLGHDDARRITKKDLMAWRDKLMQTLSAKTVSDVYLAAVRTLFNWAIQEDRLPDNPAQSVRQPLARKVIARSKGFTLEEAERILSFSVCYQPSAYLGRASSERPETSAAKRWVPILCAFTGARVTEMTQLRREDIRREGRHYVVRITPDAGSVKTGEYREVPLHHQVIDLGFLDFVEQAISGPIFYHAEDGKTDLAGARRVSGKISQWLRGSNLVPDGIAPNHAWRHRFKTVAIELGFSGRIMDAICGHAGKTAGDSYGDVTLNAKALLIDALPNIALEPVPVDANAGHAAKN